METNHDRAPTDRPSRPSIAPGMSQDELSGVDVRPSAPPRNIEDLDGAEGRAIYFRPHRYQPSDLGPVRTVVSVSVSGRRFECEMTDVSQNGVAFEWPADVEVEIGVTIPELSLSFDQHEAYSGAATVSSLRRREGTLVVGASFIDSLMNVDDVIALRDVKSYAAAGSSGLGLESAPWRVEGHAEFKSLVAELRLFLEDAREHLAEVERVLPWDVVHGEGRSAAQDALIARVKREFADEFIQRSERIDAALRTAPLGDIPALKEYSQRFLQSYFIEAPCMHRALFKPLGYPGDYEVMKYMYENQFAGPTLFAKAVSLAILTTRPGDAVRFRKNLVRDRLSEVIDRATPGERPLRFLSVAAGPAQEVFELLKQRRSIASPLEIVLFDQDKGALSYAYRRISPIVSARWSKEVTVTYLHDSIKRLLRDPALFARYGSFDVIFCAGLFDYLEMPTAVALTRNLFSNLAPGGELYIGNMVPSSPNRWFMELNLDWNLKYKTHEDLLAMGRSAAPGAAVAIREEPSGVNPFVVLTRV
jgi:SAM-dependent methyltransferase